MTENTFSLARSSFASTVAEMLDARARELTLAWLDAVTQHGAHSAAAGGAPVAESALSGHVPELVRAFGAALTEPEVPGAAARVERELTRLARLRRAQGRRLADVLSELGILQDVMLGAILAEASAQRGSVPAEALLGVVTRFNHAAREMVAVTVQLFEQDLLARRQRRASLLGGFARAVIHELRNRVNAARLSFCAYRSAPEERQGEMLETLDSSLKQLEDAVGDVFSVALAQARELPAEGRPQPLPELLEHLRHDFDELALAGRIEVRVAAPIPAIAVDAGGMQLALLNLVTNALKHTDRTKGHSWVEIRVVPGAERDEWRVDVEDNGAGLPVVTRAVGESEDAPDESREPAVAQHELGIALALEAVRELGGRLWIGANVPGEGTTVSFTLRAVATE